MTTLFKLNYQYFSNSNKKFSNSQNKLKFFSEFNYYPYFVVISLKLKREWSDRLLKDFKNTLTALKSREVMNETAYKKC